MSEQPITQDPKTNQFLPGNIWRYRPGQSGHPARYNYKSMRLKVIEYIESVDDPEEYAKCLTWSGLARYLGMSRKGLDRYAAGEIKKDTSAIVALLDYYKTLMEDQKEYRLQSKDYSTAGVIFGLKNQHGWRDEKHLTVEGEVKHELSMVVEGMPKLAQRFENAGVTIDQPDPKGLPGPE